MYSLFVISLELMHMGHIGSFQRLTGIPEANALVPIFSEQKVIIILVLFQVLMCFREKCLEVGDSIFAASN